MEIRINIKFKVSSKPIRRFGYFVLFIACIKKQFYIYIEILSIRVKIYFYKYLT